MIPMVLGGMFNYASIQLSIACCSSDANATTVIVLSLQSFTFLVIANYFYKVFLLSFKVAVSQEFCSFLHNWDVV